MERCGVVVAVVVVVGDGGGGGVGCHLFRNMKNTVSYNVILTLRWSLTRQLFVGYPMAE